MYLTPRSKKSDKWFALLPLAALVLSIAIDQPALAASESRFAEYDESTAPLVAPDPAPLFGLSLAAPGRSSVGAEIAPSLEAVLQTATPEELIPVMLFMNAQGVARSDRTRIRALPKSQRRAEGVSRLQALAQHSQADVLSFLNRLESTGEAKNLRSMWIVNGIAVELPAHRVYDLIGFDGVRRIVWDPIVGAEAMQDDVATDADVGLDENLRGDDLDPQIWWQLDKVRAPDCWAEGYDGTGVVVAIMDKGVDYTHPDIAGRLWTNPNEIAGNDIDDDNNGFVDDVNGWDFIQGDNDPMETGPGHGTQVCGIVCGNGTNGTATGVAPGAEYMPIRATSTSWSLTFDGLAYASLMQVDVIAMSVTQKWHPAPPDYAAWRAVVENELTLGIFHANSIGNKGSEQALSPIPFNIGTPGNCPSAWLHPDQYHVGGRTSIVACGSIREDEYLADTSSRGPSNWEDISVNWPQYSYEMPAAYQDYPWSEGEGGLTKPDIVAPGENTLSIGLATIGEGYVSFSGTSAATPHLAGAMAILLQANPNLTNEEMDRALQLTAVDLGAPGKDPLFGSGLLDCYAALQHVLDIDDVSLLNATVVSAASGDSLQKAMVRILPADQYRTNELGQLSLPIGAGLKTIIVEKFGFRPDTTVLSVSTGIDYDLTVEMDTLTTASLAGTVWDEEEQPLPSAMVSVVGTPLSTLTNENGQYQFTDVPAGLLYTVDAIKFNYSVSSDTTTLVPGVTDTLDLSLDLGLDDDFEYDQGWIIGTPTDDAIFGIWERDDPVGTFGEAETPVQPEDDASLDGTVCFMTQNVNPGAGKDLSDVDGGTTTLTSPIFDGTKYFSPVLSYQRWYSNNSGASPIDTFLVEISSNGGADWSVLEILGDTDNQWTEVSFELQSHVDLSDSMQIRFVASDLAFPTTVEAAIDEVRIQDNTTDIADDGDRLDSLTQPFAFQLQQNAPNPFDGGTSIRFSVPKRDQVRLEVFDVQGRRVRTLVDGLVEPGAHQVRWDGTDDQGRASASGLYFYRLRQAEEVAQGRMLRLR